MTEKSKKINTNLLFDPNYSDDLNKQISENTKGAYDGGRKDPHLFVPKFGPNGERNIIILRLLPSIYESPYKNEDGSPIIYHMAKFMEHWFDEGTVRVKETCPRTLRLINKPDFDCPICKMVNEKYPYTENMSDADSANRSKRKAKDKVFCNVYVAKDSYYPNNNGKVFKMRLDYILVELLETTLEGTKDAAGEYMVDPMNPFDIMSGPYLQLQVEQNPKNQKWTEFKGSTFQHLDKYPKKFMNGDKAKIMEVLNQTFDLYEEYMTPQRLNIKSQEQLCSLIDGIYHTNYTEELIGISTTKSGVSTTIGSDVKEEATDEAAEDIVNEVETEDKTTEDVTDTETAGEDFDSSFNEVEPEPEPAPKTTKKTATTKKVEATKKPAEDDFNFDSSEFMDS